MGSPVSTKGCGSSSCIVNLIGQEAPAKTLPEKSSPISVTCFLNWLKSHLRRQREGVVSDQTAG